VNILVVDDFIMVELAWARLVQDTPHTLTGVRDPRSLPEVLAEGTRFDLALVDIDFGRGCPTGLTAMRILSELSPDTSIVIEATDEERNRLLFLLAAFSFFEPLTLMSKSSTSEAMLELLRAVEAGELSRAAGGSAGSAGRLGGLLVEQLLRHKDGLDDLIRNGTDLLLWRALARFDRRGEVARAAHVDERTVDRFTASKSQVVDKIQAAFPEDGPGRGATGRWADDDPDGTRHQPNLVRLARFAQTHGNFFGDEAIDVLFAGRWRAPRPRQRRSRR
jgi:hypothetical protein